MLLSLCASLNMPRPLFGYQTLSCPPYPLTYHLAAMDFSSPHFSSLVNFVAARCRLPARWLCAWSTIRGVLACDVTNLHILSAGRSNCLTTSPIKSTCVSSLTFTSFLRNTPLQTAPICSQAHWLFRNRVHPEECTFS